MAGLEDEQLIELGPAAAVLFDLDWTLVDSDHIWPPARRALAAKLGLRWDEQVATLGRGRPQAEVVSLLVGLAGQRGTRSLTRHLGRRLTQGNGPASRLLVRHYLRFVASVTSAAIRSKGASLALPGAVALLDSLSAEGVPCALVTQSSRAVTEQVLAHCLDLPSERRGAAARFAVVVCGDDGAGHKPSPAPYLHAASKLGVRIADCVVVEDSLEGARAGETSGARVLVVNRSARKLADIAEKVPGAMTAASLQQVRWRVARGRAARTKS